MRRRGLVSSPFFLSFLRNETLVLADDESVPTIQCSKCCKWHHQRCVDRFGSTARSFTCPDCRPTLSKGKSEKHALRYPDTKGYPFPETIDFPSHGYRDRLSENPRTKYPVPNSNYGLLPTPNFVLDMAGTEKEILRPNFETLSSSLNRRQQGFFEGLAGLVTRRNKPLPPSQIGSRSDIE